MSVSCSLLVSEKMSGFGRFIRRTLDREPMAVVGAMFGIIGVSFATMGPVVRSALGYNTFQWNGVDKDALAVERAATSQFVREALGQAPQLKHN